MTLMELQRLLEQEGLQRITSALLRCARPTIEVVATGTVDSSIRIGASKMGGLPDLHSSTEWPHWHEPMAFIGQFNLAEIGELELDGDKLLPTKGLLSFFYETDGEPLYSARWGLPEGDNPRQLSRLEAARAWRVLFYDGEIQNLNRRDAPLKLNKRGRFRPCQVSYRSAVTLPDVDGPEISGLELQRNERRALIKLEPNVNRNVTGSDGHHLLGYPYGLGRPTLVDCDPALSAEWTALPRAAVERRRKIEQEVNERWCRLLQVDSSRTWEWTGAGAA